MEKCTDDENCTAYGIDPVNANMCIIIIKPVDIDASEEDYTCNVKNIIYKEEDSEVPQYGLGVMMEEIIEKGNIPEEERCNHNS